MNLYMLLIHIINLKKKYKIYNNFFQLKESLELLLILKMRILRLGASFGIIST